MGILKNIELQLEIYPEWTCRVYLDDTVSVEMIEKIRNTSAEVIEMPTAKEHLAMFWRFEPLKDTTIERFIVRDADARLSVREAAAVKEWIESGKEFHIMRDNLRHHQYIMGGMWGATQEFIQKEKELYDNELNEFISGLNPNTCLGVRGMYFGQDQRWLRIYIWKKIKDSHIAHIGNLPNLKFTGQEKLFPIENPDGMFVGKSYSKS